MGRGCINKPLEVTDLIPFNLLVDMAFNEDIRHVIPDWELDLVEEIWNKALSVFCQKG